MVHFRDKVARQAIEWCHFRWPWKLNGFYDDFGVHIMPEVLVITPFCTGRKSDCQKTWPAMGRTDNQNSSHFQVLKLALFRKRRAGLSAIAGLSCLYVMSLRCKFLHRRSCDVVSGWFGQDFRVNQRCHCRPICPRTERQLGIGQLPYLRRQPITRWIRNTGFPVSVVVMTLVNFPAKLCWLLTTPHS